MFLNLFMSFYLAYYHKFWMSCSPFPNPQSYAKK